LSDGFKVLGQEIDRSLREVTKVTVAEENDFGRRIITSLESALGGTLVSAGTTVNYLRKVAKPMLGKVKRKSIGYQFYVLRGVSFENAFAVPGGHIVVTQPLLDGWIKNEAQLAVVLGHEIAHVDLRHPVAVLQYLKTLGLSSDDIVGQALVQFAQTPYSSNLEESSDKLGAGFAHASGYSVFQAVALWEDRDKKPNRRSGGAGAPGGFLGEILEEVASEISHVVSSHPDPGRRACFLRQVAHDLYRDDPMNRAYVGRTNWERKRAFPSSVF